MVKVFYTFLLFFLCIAQSYLVQAEDTYIRGFYRGVNVFLRNPYNSDEGRFCIEKIYLNGKSLVDNPVVSAYEVELGDMRIGQRIVIRITHTDGCAPEVINPEVIEQGESFNWVKVYIDANSINWSTSAETGGGLFYIQREGPSGWDVVDTIRAKGDLFLNQYSVVPDHTPGNNAYQICYQRPEEDEICSDIYNFFSNKESIGFVIDDQAWTIEFTKAVQFELLTRDRRKIKGGKSESVDIAKLPRGWYILKFDGKEEEIQKN